MAEVEAGALMDAVSEPGAEVLIVDPSPRVLVPLLHQLIDVFIVWIKIAEVSEEVLACNVAVMILVHEEECLANGVEVAAELAFQ